MKLGMIVGMTRSSGIGINGSIPWCHREDLLRFRNITIGCPLIMGRKTWESLPIKPLPERYHIVITNNTEYTISNEFVQIVHSRDDAIKTAHKAVLLNTFKNPQE
jgi:dihydrofolate reductase